MLVVEILDDVIMVRSVDVDDDGLDGGVALDEHSCESRNVSKLDTGTTWKAAAGVMVLTSDGARHGGWIARRMIPSV